MDGGRSIPSNAILFPAEFCLVGNLAAVELHLHSGYDPLQFAGRKFVELDKIRGKFLDQAEYTPYRVARGDILNTVKNDFLPDAVHFKQVLDIDYFGISRPDFEGIQPRSDFFLQVRLDAERVIGFNY